MCISVYVLPDCVPARGNIDPGGVGELMRFVYTDNHRLPWSCTSPLLKPSPKSASPHWLLLHTVFVFMINDPTGVYP